ncbi:MAG: geranylgeranyl reductase family protein, partial [Myxococcota bacterium]
MSGHELFDAVVVGGGPAGATAAEELAGAGRRVALLDKAGRIKPCGGAIPPRLIRDFEIPSSLLCARIRSARMVSPTQRTVDMPIDGGYVGMVNREVFDEYLRERAAERGAERITGSFERIGRDDEEGAIVHYQAGDRERTLRTRLVIGADGALSKVQKEVSPTRPPCVFAYHEIVSAPSGRHTTYDGARCDVVYDGATSPDFYGWVF